MMFFGFSASLFFFFGLLLCVFEFLNMGSLLMHHCGIFDQVLSLQFSRIFALYVKFSDFWYLFIYFWVTWCFKFHSC